ncbi:MAG: hypothetical protein DM484_21220 [Candidatus Methylumidiphilus alinenensis]|uniref:Tyr recombinase domain-containing protein n=1 Tax=Candidatus Methylumidiphilus alinenensis TaxID=2202197 RepID=A0A2W4QSA2_9GAMM|nr:MAG: hypothetical protein DM484_21220 [Candidatus Methylumidiphilus alinenensis]
MATTKTKLPGLYWDKTTQQGSIDKRIPGIGRVRHRFAASSWAEAEAQYHQAIQTASLAATAQRLAAASFRAAATHYLTTEHKTSLARDADSLAQLDPFIGHLPLDQIHQGTLQPYIDHRRAQGRKSATIDRDLAIVRRILTLASRVWRTPDNLPWLSTAPPLIPHLRWQDDAKPYPLDREDQAKLILALPAHLQRMALFGINTGAREHVICWLRWEWETPLPEIGTSIFVVPGRPNQKIGWEGTKSKQDAIIPINRIARSVIEECRGIHPEWVFTQKGGRIERMNNHGWRTAWKAAGLPTGESVLSGPHNLRHTFARRLRMAGVNLETRKALMGHANGDITLHYSPAELKELLEAVERIAEIEKGTMTMLKAVNS